MPFSEDESVFSALFGKPFSAEKIKYKSFKKIF